MESAIEDCKTKLISAANALDDVDGGLLGFIDEITGDRLLNLRGETAMAPMANAVKNIASTLPGVADRLRGEGAVYEAAVQRYKQAETGTGTGFMSIALITTSIIQQLIDSISTQPGQPGQPGQPEQPGQNQPSAPGSASFDYAGNIGGTLANIDSEYYKKGNISFNGGYMGECTWYAYGRFYEVTGIALTAAPHAKFWLDRNRSDSRVNVIDGAENITAPAIVVKTEGTYGHVMFVEHIERDANNNPVAVYFTECNNDVNSTYNPGVDCILQKMSYQEFLSRKKPAGYITAA
jgi:hypothetical protein